jgi:predicted DNA-binding transcriptional regulator AlpA
MDNFYTQNCVCGAIELDGYLRLKQVLKLIPVSKSVWWEGCKTGQYPKPYKIGLRAIGWKTRDVYACMAQFKPM